jgi:hypothetical protein
MFSSSGESSEACYQTKIINLEVAIAAAAAVPLTAVTCSLPVCSTVRSNSTTGLTHSSRDVQ